MDENPIEETKEGTAIEQRGEGGNSTATRQNFLLMWGCRPSKTVIADTNMINEIADVMTDRFNRDTLSLSIP